MYAGSKRRGQRCRPIAERYRAEHLSAIAELDRTVETCISEARNEIYAPACIARIRVSRQRDGRDQIIEFGHEHAAPVRIGIRDCSTVEQWWSGAIAAYEGSVSCEIGIAEAVEREARCRAGASKRSRINLLRAVGRKLHDECARSGHAGEIARQRNRSTG